MELSGNTVVCTGAVCLDAMVLFGKNCSGIDSAAAYGIQSSDEHCKLSHNCGISATGTMLAFEPVATREDARARKTATATDTLRREDLLAIGLASTGDADSILEDVTTAIDSAEGAVESMQLMIVDDTKAWVIENAGKWWVAEMILDGIRQLGSELSIGVNYTKHAEGASLDCVLPPKSTGSNTALRSS